MRELPITLTCDCREIAYVQYGERWTCPRCERTWDTSKIPEDEYARLVGRVRRYRLIALGPPLLFVLVFGYAVFVLPKVRERATEAVRRSARTWELHPE